MEDKISEIKWQITCNWYTEVSNLFEKALLGYRYYLNVVMYLNIIQPRFCNNKKVLVFFLYYDPYGLKGITISV